MKKIFFFLFFLTFTTSISFGQIYSENFSYTSGSLISTSGNWTPSNDAGINPITVTSPGLSFVNYIGSDVGNAVTLTTSGEEDSSSIFPPQSSGSVYVSFMVNVSSAQADGDYFLGLGSSSFDDYCYTHIRSSGSGFQFGLKRANDLFPVYNSTVYSFDETYLLVVKYEFIPTLNTDDEASLFIFDSSNPPPATEPIPILTVTSFQFDADNIARITLHQGDPLKAPGLVIDGIYVDNSWNNGVLPVELSSFVSSINGRNVILNWATASESNNSGFDIERSSDNSSWFKVGNVTGKGTSSIAHSYSYTDRNLASGIYNYRLKQIDFNGNFEYFNLSNEVNIGVPTKFELSQNYPNPFNPSTKINYDLPVDGKVSLKIFDMSGKEVMSLVNETVTAGYNSVSFNGSNLSSGIYFYRINVEGNGSSFVSTKKMTLIK